MDRFVFPLLEMPQRKEIICFICGLKKALSRSLTHSLSMYMQTFIVFGLHKILNVKGNAIENNEFMVNDTLSISH
jgi:hypothetical protein